MASSRLSYGRYSARKRPIRAFTSFYLVVDLVSKQGSPLLGPVLKLAASQLEDGLGAQASHGFRPPPLATALKSRRRFGNDAKRGLSISMSGVPCRTVPHGSHASSSSQPPGKFNSSTFSLPTTWSGIIVLRSERLRTSIELCAGRSLGRGMALYGQTGNCKLTRIQKSKRQIDARRPMILHHDIGNIDEM